MNSGHVQGALRVLVEAWEPAWASVRDHVYGKELLELIHLPPFRSAWMTYLSAPYAAKIVPPTSAIVERILGGGALMLATTDLFSPENSEHVAVADLIQTSMKPLQWNPLLQADQTDGLYARFPIWVKCFQSGRWSTYNRAVFNEIFAEATFEYLNSRLRVAFLDGSRSYVAFGTPIGRDDDIFTVAFDRCGGGRSVIDAIYELARRTRSLYFGRRIKVTKRLLIWIFSITCRAIEPGHGAQN